ALQVLRQHERSITHDRPRRHLRASTGDEAMRETIPRRTAPFGARARLAVDARAAVHVCGALAVEDRFAMLFDHAVAFGPVHAPRLEPDVDAPEATRLAHDAQRGVVEHDL